MVAERNRERQRESAWRDTEYRARSTRYIVLYAYMPVWQELATRAVLAKGGAKIRIWVSTSLASVLNDEA